MSENLKVLIVDDEEDLAEIVAEALEREFDSTYVTSGKEALELVDKGEVDVIISDSNMPGMTGLELLEKLRDNSKDILFYLATGDIGVTEQMILEKGGHGVFEKPFSTSVVVGKISEDFQKLQ